MKFFCSNCGQKLELPDGFEKDSVFCSSCGEKTKIPVFSARITTLSNPDDVSKSEDVITGTFNDNNIDSDHKALNYETTRKNQVNKIISVIIVLIIIVVGVIVWNKHTELKAKIKRDQKNQESLNQEIELTNIRIEKALLNLDINSAIENIKIYNVYDKDNTTKQNLLISLENLNEALTLGKLNNAQVIISETNLDLKKYQKLNEIYELIKEVNGSLILLKRGWHFGRFAHSDKSADQEFNLKSDITASMKVLEGKREDFSSIMYCHNKIYEKLNYDLPIRKKGDLNVDFAISAYLIWTSGSTQIEFETSSTDQIRELSYLGIEVLNRKTMTLLPKWKIANSIKERIPIMNPRVVADRLNTEKILKCFTAGEALTVFFLKEYNKMNNAAINGNLNLMRELISENTGDGELGLALTTDPNEEKLTLGSGIFEHGVDGTSVLQNAVAANQYEAVKFLLENHAHADYSNGRSELSRKTPLQISKDPKISNLLQKYGAKK
jgi:hypothetical protein